MMPTGSKWQLFVPAILAYGERGTSLIPPNSVLILEVELVEVVQKINNANPFEKSKCVYELLSYPDFC